MKAYIQGLAFIIALCSYVHAQEQDLGIEAEGSTAQASLPDQLQFVNLQAEDYALQVDNFIATIEPLFTEDNAYLSDYKIEQCQRFLNDLVEPMITGLFVNHDQIIVALQNKGLNELAATLETNMQAIQQGFYDVLDRVDESNVQWIPFLNSLDYTLISLEEYAETVTSTKSVLLYN